MNVRNSPLTPVSLRDGESISVRKFPTLETDNVHQNGWGPLASPPISGSSSTVSRTFPLRGTTNFTGNSKLPSPPMYITRPSGGVRSYAQSENDMNRIEGKIESFLLEHYLVIKQYLSGSLKNDNINSKPKKAHDKLVRLSPVQFQELSTDIFDEISRRQQFEKRTGQKEKPVPYLLPRATIHPKRNQARQKLSTLAAPRFRDLATDVFYELERRFPRLASNDTFQIGSPATSVDGETPRIDLPFSENRQRKLSDASSTTYSVRSISRSSPMPLNNDVLPSPNLPAYDFGRPTPKSFQSNTIVPNKITIVEDDETDREEGEEESREGGVLGSEDIARTELNHLENSNNPSETYQERFRTLNENLRSMEKTLKKKDDELSMVTKGQSERVTQVEMERNNLQKLAVKLEAKLADVQSLNEKMKIEMDRVKAAHAEEIRDFQAQIRELQLSQEASNDKKVSLETVPENMSLGDDLDQERRVTEDVRIQAQEILKEMRIISEQNRSSNEREEYLSSHIKRLEVEVKDWRNRYIKTKAQLRNFHGSSSDLAIQRDAARIASGNEFTDENGIVKDINVIKFQISIDELIRDSRIEEPAKILESMKNVILNVRNITQDILEATSSEKDITLQQKKLKYNVTLTAKNLITASKNFAVAKGLSPVSLLDAAASHLTSAIIELLRSIKIRPTSELELESNDVEDMTLIDTIDDPIVSKLNLEKIDSPQKEVFSKSEVSPKPIWGLDGVRLSTNSSMYIPINSQKESEPMTPYGSNYDPHNPRNISISQNVSNNIGKMGSFMSMKGAFDFKPPTSDAEQLKIYLEDLTALLVQNVQSLVTVIRSEAGITATGNSINSISDVVGKVIYNTERAMKVDENSKLRLQGEPVIKNLKAIQQRLIEAGIIGRQIADEGRDDDESERAWRSWNQSLPSIAFEIAREMKELVVRVDTLNVIDTKDGVGIE